MMRFMKRLLRLGMTMLLLLSLTAATALAAETATVTVNVTNTPVRGDVRLEKTGLQLVRFTDEQDEWGKVDCQASATPKKTSKGVRQPNLLRGL